MSTAETEIRIPGVLTKGAILVKRMPMHNAKFEVTDTSPGRVCIRRIDGQRKWGAAIELDASILHKYGYLLEEEAGPHPLELEKERSRNE